MKTKRKTYSVDALTTVDERVAQQLPHLRTRSYAQPSPGGDRRSPPYQAAQDVLGLRRDVPMPHTQALSREGAVGQARTEMS